MRALVSLVIVIFSLPVFATNFDTYQKAASIIVNSLEVQERITKTLEKIHSHSDYDAPIFRGVRFSDGFSKFESGKIVRERVVFDVEVGGLEQGRYCLRLSLNGTNFNDLKIEDEFRVCQF